MLHIHGNVSQPSNLYLPTEVAEEPYFDDDDTTERSNFRGAMIQAIHEAKRVVLYRLGLSPLDAELGQILASGIHDSGSKEIFVIDPNHHRGGRACRHAERCGTRARAGYRSAFEQFGQDLVLQFW